MEQKGSTIEEVYEALNKSVNLIQENTQGDYIDALIDTGENLFNEEIIQENLDDFTKKRLEKIYSNLPLHTYSNETIRKAYQLAILNGIKDSIQPNHEMTPDAISLFVSYLINKLTEKKEEYYLLDPAVGTGNLLTAILNNSPKKITATGVDADETLLKLAYVSSNLQKHPVELVLQDSLQPLLMTHADVVVCDLPIGYYPNDAVAENYELKAESGHSFSHHLLIEQSLTYTNAGGYLVFLVPNFLFEGEGASRLNQYINSQAHIIGLLQLPFSLFKNKKYAKSIFIIQKKGENTKPPKQALLAELPSFKKQASMNDMVNQLNNWFKENL